MMLGFLLLLWAFNGMAQLAEDEVMIWGIYLDLQDPQARRAASILSQAGYSVQIDSLADPPHLVFAPGTPGAIGKILRKKKKDGIRAMAYTFSDDCGENLLVQDSLVRYKYIRNNFINQFAIQRYESVSDQVEDYGRDYMDGYLREQNRLFRKYLKGKTGLRGLEDMSWALLGIPMDERWQSDELSFDFIKKKKKLLTIRFDTITGKKADRFIALQRKECVPFDRRTTFKKLTGTVEWINPLFYIPRPENYISRTYQLNFAKNSADYSTQSIQPIIDLLRRDSLSIMKARVEGYASIEGSFENNRKLQERRASILLDVLEKYNDEKIIMDTIITTENWELFREQLQDSPHGWLDSLSEDEIKGELEKDSLQIRLEPLLAAQRKAKLTILLSKRLSNSEKVTFAFRDIRHAIWIELNKQRAGFDARPRVHGILNYLDGLVERGIFTREEINRDIPKSEYLTWVQFYKAREDYHNGKFSQVFPIESVIRDAHSLFKNMYEAHSRREPWYAGMALNKDVITRMVDVHDLTFTLVKEGRLPISMLELFHYPDIPLYYPLTLHHLYMLEKWKEEGAGQTASLQGLPFLDHYPRYYLLLKKIVLESDEDILRYVYRSDQILAFDLFQFLSVNVNGWEVQSGTYYDPDVDREVMMRQMTRLNSLSSRLCANQLDQINLDFNLKTLHHFQNIGYLEGKYNAQFVRSFNHLKNYFNTVALEMEDEYLLKVANQFVLLNKLYLSRDGSNAAYQLLNRVAREREPTSELLELYLRLAYYHDPQFISLVRQYKGSEWCDLFTGKYGMIPYGSLEKEYCKCD